MIKKMHKAGIGLVATFALAAGMKIAAQDAPSADNAGATKPAHSLRLYNTHTGERATITYKYGDTYDRDGLAQINTIMRDHRRKETHPIATATIDRLHAISTTAQQHMGLRDVEVHIISGYRSEKTNNALIANGGGQARTSQHSLGTAVDFRLYGTHPQSNARVMVDITLLRDISVCTGEGGTGYYPQSHNRFVHIDTARTRTWPGGWGKSTANCARFTPLPQ